MNRLFGKGKPKEPPPDMGACISNVSHHHFIMVEIMVMIILVNFKLDLVYLGGQTG